MDGTEMSIKMLERQVKVERWLDGGVVQRFHQWPMIHRQTVAEHSWNMLMIAAEVYPRNGHPSRSLLDRAIMFHDVAEGRTGISDVSAYCKWEHPRVAHEIHEAEIKVNRTFGLQFLNTLPDLVVGQLKYCDMLELVWTILSERRLGNRVLYDAIWDEYVNKDLYKMYKEIWTAHEQYFYSLLRRQGNEFS